MIFQNFLFSRSTLEDYRWILVPDFFSDEDKRVLEELMWEEEIRPSLQTGISNPFSFCLFFLSKSYIIGRFWRTNYMDKNKRPIDCIDGIAVDKTEAWFLRFALPSFLTDQSILLNSWETLDFQSCDLIKGRPSEKTVLDLNLLPKVVLSENDNIEQLFSFDQIGFERLVRYLSPWSKRRLDLLQIAYGIPASATSNFQDFNIVVINEKLSQRNLLPGFLKKKESPPQNSNVSPTQGFNERVNELRKSNNPPKETRSG